MDAVLPVATLVIGYFGAMLTEWLRDACSSRRERRGRAEQRERDALLQLQDALQQLSRAASGLASARRRRFEDRQEWLKSEAFLVHYDAVAEARMALVALASRLEDGELRGLAGRTWEAEAALTGTASADEALEAQARLSDAATAAIERAGELSREAGSAVQDGRRAV